MKKKEFRYSCSAGQRNGIEKTEAGLKAEKKNVADALLSFMYGSFEDRRRYEAALNAITDEEAKKVFMEKWQDGRSSMNNIGEYAHQLGEKLKGRR